MAKKKVKIYEKTPKEVFIPSGLKKPADKLTLSLDEDLLELHQNLKLQIELVPGGCWWKNIRSNVTKKQWDTIRYSVYEKANFVCEICGDKGTKHPVECHEVWVYDDASLWQRLSHFQALCPLCHQVKHIGFAGVIGKGDQAFERFVKINELPRLLANEIKHAVFIQWAFRSQQVWKTNIEHIGTYGIDPETLIKSKETKKNYR